jgi:hypothetical protein
MHQMQKIDKAAENAHRMDAAGGGQESAVNAENRRYREA